MKGKKGIRHQTRRQKKLQPSGEKRWNGRPMPHAPQTKSRDK